MEVGTDFGKNYCVYLSFSDESGNLLGKILLDANGEIIEESGFKNVEAAAFVNKSAQQTCYEFVLTFNSEDLSGQRIVASRCLFERGGEYSANYKYLCETVVWEMVKNPLYAAEEPVTKATTAKKTSENTTKTAKSTTLKQSTTKATTAPLTKVPQTKGNKSNNIFEQNENETTKANENGSILAQAFSPQNEDAKEIVMGANEQLVKTNTSGPKSAKTVGIAAGGSLVFTAVFLVIYQAYIIKKAKTRESNQDK
jgi:hypothetical protein